MTMDRIELRELEIQCIRNQAGLSPPPDSRDVMRAIESFADALPLGKHVSDVASDLDEANGLLGDLKDEIATREAKLEELEGKYEEKEALLRQLERQLDLHRASLEKTPSRKGGRRVAPRA